MNWTSLLWPWNFRLLLIWRQSSPFERCYCLHVLHHVGITLSSAWDLLYIREERADSRLFTKFRDLEISSFRLKSLTAPQYAPCRLNTASPRGAKKGREPWCIQGVKGKGGCLKGMAGGIKLPSEYKLYYHNVISIVNHFSVMQQ